MTLVKYFHWGLYPLRSMSGKDNFGFVHVLSMDLCSSMKIHSTHRERGQVATFWLCVNPVQPYKLRFTNGALHPPDRFVIASAERITQIKKWIVYVTFLLYFFFFALRTCFTHIREPSHALVFFRSSGADFFATLPSHLAPIRNTHRQVTTIFPNK